MKQKIVNNILIGCTVIVGLAACSKKLDMEPESTLTDAGFWKSSNDLILACNELYQSLPVITNNVNAVWTDDGYGSAPNSISDGTRTVPGTDNAFNIPYALIRKANTILEKSVTIKDDAARVRRYNAPPGRASLRDRRVAS